MRNNWIRIRSLAILVVAIAPVVALLWTTQGSRLGLLLWAIGLCALQPLLLIKLDRRTELSVTWLIGFWQGLLGVFGQPSTMAGLISFGSILVVGLILWVANAEDDALVSNTYGLGVATGVIVSALSIEHPQRWTLLLALLGFTAVARFGAYLVGHRLATNQALGATNQRLIDDLQYRADHDGLTGAYNRARISTHITSLLEQKRPFVCTAIDIDDFRTFNEMYGQARGDQYLHDVVQNLSHCSHDAVVGRIESDRFIVIEPAGTSTGLGGRNSQAEPVHEAALASTPEGVAPMSCTVAMLYVDDPHEFTTETLLQATRATIEAGKRNGGGRTQIFDDEIASGIVDERRLRQEFARGLEQHEVVPYVQPIVDLRSAAIVGGEVLARWIRDGEEVPAYKFIETAHRGQLLDEVDDAMFEQIAEWRRSHPEFKPLYLSLNVGPDRLYAAGQRFGQAKAGEDDLRGMVFEMTERGIVHNPEAATAQLAEWRSRGALIYLDDFGTGFSSLDLLTSLPIDGLKVDRKFVRGAGTEAASQAVVAATVELARRLDLRLIAEGVETRHEALLMRDMGIQAAQGWLFLKAVPLEEFSALVAAGTNWAEVLHANAPGQVSPV